jgi:hypothetical protein
MRFLAGDRLACLHIQRRFMKLNRHKRLKESLGKDYACYVLITCQESSANGEMEVEMSYEGDAVLAAYLLEGAQNIIDEQHEQKISAKPNLRVIK